MKMTKQEVKEEYKNTEGNPEIKGRIRRIQRQMALSRMMQNVPQADVIVRNPTHFAVALKYDPEKNGAPVVLAKGQDYLALRIIKLGEENGVSIVENRPLARALYASCEVDREIPAEFYGAVAACRTFGEWLLLPLLCRPEAESLRSLAGAEVPELCASPSPWRVEIHDGEAYRDRPLRSALAGEEGPAETPFDAALLSFVYPYQRQSTLPAKLTATQLKGRLLDQEIAEHAAHTPYLRPLSQPRFRRESRGLTPAERGSATHLVLQYLDFGVPDVSAQIAALTEKNLLTPEQAQAVDTAALRTLLASPLAEEIRAAAAAGRKVLREYRFTLLISAREYAPQAPEEDSILLQGVADCCFETEDGLVVVDFKTDRVRSPEEVRQRAEHYRPQLEAYSLALSRVLEQPVVRRVLHFLTPGQTVEL